MLHNHYNMANKLDFLNNTNLQIIVFRKLLNIAISKGFTATQWAEKSNIDQGDLSKVTNWKKWLTEDKFLRLLETIWVWKKQLEQIVTESKIEELKIYHWQDLEIIPECNLNTLDELDFDKFIKDNWVKFKMWWHTISEEDKKEIINFIKYKANK